MSIKHFETATIGAENARAILAQLGEVLEVRSKRVLVCEEHEESDDYFLEDVLFAVGRNGNQMRLRPYCGDTPERIAEVAAMTWSEEDDYEYNDRCFHGIFFKFDPDRTGACL